MRADARAGIRDAASGHVGPGTSGSPPRADWGAWLIAFATFAAYTTISVSHYMRLTPGTWDLGIFTEYVRRLAHLQAPVVPIRGHDFNLLGDHFTPIVALIAPFFRLFPTPVTLLVAQALLVAVSVVPVCRAAQGRLGTGVSRAIGVAYGFSWGFQQMANFAFHELAFAVPLLAFSLSALVRCGPRAAMLWALPLVFVKEDQGLTVGAIGLVMLAAGVARRRTVPRPAAPEALSGLAGRADAGAWIKAGALLALWGPVWSLLAIEVLIPHFNPAHHYMYWNDAGVLGAHGRSFSVSGLLTQITHDTGTKLRTVTLLLLPVVFLALGSPLVLIAVPSLALRFLSTHYTYWGTGYHYNAPLMPIMFLAAIDGLARITSRATAQRSSVADRSTADSSGRVPNGPALRFDAIAPLGAATMVLIATVLAFSFPLSHLWHPGTYVVGPKVRAEAAAMARVPDGVTVEASETMLAPLAARDDTSWIENHQIHDPMYIVLDTLRDGPRQDRRHPLLYIEKIHPGAAYQEIFASRGAYVFRRVRLPVPVARPGGS